MKILVCDDDEGVLEIMKIMLEAEGYEVVEVKNGKGIVKKVLDFKPNLIFLDLWMPGIDGKEITKLLKKDPHTKGIPVIILSALNDIDVICKEIGAEGFLSKPFDMGDMYQIVRKYS